MTTIPMFDPDEATGKRKEILDQAARLVTRNMGLPARVPNVYLAMAHHPDYLEANWRRSKAIYQGSGLPLLTRECVHIAISTVNNCHY